MELGMVVNKVDVNVGVILVVIVGEGAFVTKMMLPICTKIYCNN